MRLGLTHKIFGGYLVLITLLVGIGGYGGVAIYGLMGDYRSLVVEGVPIQRNLDSLAQVFRLQTGSEKKFNVVRSVAFAKLFADQTTEWETIGQSLAERLTDPSQAIAMDDLLAQHRVYNRLVADNMTTPSPPRHDTGVLVDMISVGLDDLSKSVRESQDRRLAETQRKGDRTLGITMGLSLLTVTLGLVAAFGVSTLLTRPVRRLKRATEEVARGIFNRKVPVGATDEIGDLGAAFNRMAEKLQSLDELREEFIAFVSHELKTPLTSLKEANALMLEELAGPINDRQRQLLGIIAEDGQKIERLVAEMLELSKMEAGMMTFDLAPELFPGIVSRALKEMSPVAEKHRVVLTMVGGSDVTVVADRSRIRQVITNLVSNAIKFSPNGSMVTVDWITGSGKVICSVTDEGPGIPEEAREMIFEKFHQLAPSALSGMRGTGLGLPIARKILSAHGGQLWVECPPQGGSVFRFSLPSQPRPVSTQKTDDRSMVKG
jgi:two-component system sensor histidine kinase GlrK